MERKVQRKLISAETTGGIGIENGFWVKVLMPG